MSDFNAWPHAGWWETKEAAARGMTVADLMGARLDCLRAAKNFPGSDLESKYHDEGSIYVQEMRRRESKGAKS